MLCRVPRVSYNNKKTVTRHANIGTHQTAGEKESGKDKKSFNESIKQPQIAVS